MDDGKVEAEGRDDTEAEEGGGLGVGLLALEATEFLTQDADPGGTTLVDACNGLN